MPGQPAIVGIEECYVLDIVGCGIAPAIARRARACVSLLDDHEPAVVRDDVGELGPRRNRRSVIDNRDEQIIIPLRKRRFHRDRQDARFALIEGDDDVGPCHRFNYVRRLAARPAMGKTLMLSQAFRV